MTASTAACASLRRSTDQRLVAAAHALLEALRAVDVAMQVRDEAVAAAVARAQRPTRQVGAHIRGCLTNAGFTPEEIDRLGVSDGNIRLICGRVSV